MRDDLGCHIEPDAPVLTPRYRNLLADAARFATTEGHTYLGAEHLLMAMIDDGSSVASAGAALRVEYDDAVR